MVRGVAFALMLALAWVCCISGSVLMPTYVLPPDSFVRDQRSLGSTPDSEASGSQRTIRRLIGGHMKLKPHKEYGDLSKNSFAYDEKSDSGKFTSAIAPNQSSGTVGWNQEIWDDGMLMSSAGEGKESGKGEKEDDEEKKTLLDQVAEGKYGLIQNEIFVKEPKRPGIVSYEVNKETRNKDNVHNLGGLKKDEIWLAEDHLLVLKGGSFPDNNKDNDRRPWPPIDNYEAPRRQVKLPQKPKIPPPFPVRLHDDGPLVFLTPQGSVPAPLFPPFPQGESDGPIPFAPFPFPPGTPNAESGNQGNSTAGGAPFTISPFPFLPGNASEEPPFPFPPSINGSFPEGFPPGAAFLPPPSNQSDLYDEDDPSIYYPPPYNFSYHAEKSNVPAGPLVPGIILPPPPDFFAPMEEKSTTTEYAAPEKTTSTTTKATQKPTYKRPTTTVSRKPYKTRPTATTESSRTTEQPSTITTPVPVEIVTPKVRQPPRVVQIPHRNSLRGHVSVESHTTPKPERPNYNTRHRLTSKPLSVSVIYDYPEQNYNTNVPTTSEKPYIYNIPENTPNLIQDNLVTSTPVPLRAYYTNTQSNHPPTTKLQPVYNRPKENALASFYFFDEQPKTTAAPIAYFDGRNYYKTIPVRQTQANSNGQNGYAPTVDVEYGSIDQEDNLFFWPQKQGTKTLTQEYFSIQKPKTQQIYLPQKVRPDPFYQQIADIQQTIDYYTTNRPKQHRSPAQKPKAITSRPVYQFSYQSRPRPEHLSFRAPKLDPEPFRPMVSYSKPFNIENDFNAISPSPAYNQQYLIENVKVTTETPTSSKYYPKTQPSNEEYVDTPVHKDIRAHSHTKNKNHIAVQDDKTASVVHINHRKHPSTTSNPINHGYYTKQDERYFDDITKNSFDIFGKKIEDNTHDVNGVAVTPPLGTVRTPINNGINLQYDYDIIESQSPNPPTLEGDTLVNDRLPRPTIHPDSEPIAPQIHTNSELVLEPKPPSLISDTIVNDRLPRPTINPDSEFIPIPNPAYRNAQYKVQTQVQRPQYTGEQYDLNQPSLAGDTAVNYKRPLPPVNPDAEWVSPVNTAGEGRPGSFVSYRLPGEGAHVYFLTPQAAQVSRERYNTYRPPGYGR